MQAINARMEIARLSEGKPMPNALLGSVSEKVVRNAKVPVLVVRAKRP